MIELGYNFVSVIIRKELYYEKIVKYFMMVIALCIFALTANSFSMAEASALYTPASYWNNDTNYPLAFHKRCK